MKFMHDLMILMDKSDENKITLTTFTLQFPPFQRNPWLVSELKHGGGWTSDRNTETALLQDVWLCVHNY
jgi:hypothetical protein